MSVARTGSNPSTTVGMGETIPLKATIGIKDGRNYGGFNAAAPNGVLSAAGAGVQPIAGYQGRTEVTHTTPKAAANGQVTFDFNFTAPSTCPTSTVIKVWGNNVNGDWLKTNDHAASTTITITTTCKADGASCTAASQCASGFCVDGVCCKQQSCSGADQCHNAGQCQPTTGVCGPPINKANGTGCNDQELCTQTDTCQNGVCTGSNPITCTAMDACHLAGTCSGGTCSEPFAPQGAVCDDGNSSTSGDRCNGAGVCSGTAAPGSLFAWGLGYYGQLGTGESGSTATKLSPTRVSNTTIEPVISIAEGAHHTIALRADGTVWTWGFNQFGQLGDPSFTGQYRATPAQVTGAGQMVVAVAAGAYHSLALLSTGQVLAWGNNGNGELGDPAFTGASSAAPRYAQVTDITSIAAGAFHSVALAGDGKVWVWGNNSFGQSGNGTTAARSAPTAVTVPSRARSIAAGFYFTLAVGVDGIVNAWGRNDYGVLGVPQEQLTQSLTPRFVPGVGLGRAIAASGHHVVLLMADGTVWAWGRNAYGQLGNGTTSSGGTSMPVRVSNLDNVSAVATGSEHSAALRADGTVWTWGANDAGQLGNGGATPFSSTPIQVLGSASNPIEKISSGYYHLIAVEARNTVQSWGTNLQGVLGVGKTQAELDASETPMYVNLAAVTDLSTGCYHQLALRADGTVWAWGRNVEGQLGVSGSDRTAPVQVPGVSNAIAVSAGCFHSLALLANGKVLAWGEGRQGQLGDGNFALRSSAAQVSNLNAVLAIAAGGTHNYALNAWGPVRAWGSNSHYQLGDTGGDRALPVQIPYFDPGRPVRAISAGYASGAAITSNGVLHTWGANHYGMLGRSTPDAYALPGEVSALTSPVRAVSAGLYHMFANVLGYAFAWGLNSSGQLGLGPVGSPITTPTGLFQGPVVKSISAGLVHSSELLVDGTVWSVGAGTWGELGNGTTESKDRFVRSNLSGATVVRSSFQFSAAIAR